MLNLLKTINELKTDIEEIKSNIKLIMATFIQNNNQNPNMVKQELIDFISNNESCNNRFCNVYVKEKIFDISECEYIMNESNNHSFIRSPQFDDCKIVDIDQIIPLCDMISNKLYDTILPSIISLYDLKTTQHISVNVIDLFITKCKKHINIYTKPTLFSLCIPLKNSIEIEVNSQKITANSGDLIIYCGNKETKITHKQLCIIINVEFEYHS
jgi:predicted phosphoadenosine phosphosulfate sulfurtransferase